MAAADGVGSKGLQDQPRRDASKWIGLFAVAARSVRKTLVNHARNPKATYHEHDQVGVELNKIVESFEQASHVRLVELDRVLTVLGKCNLSQRVLVELRLFGALSVNRIAVLLGVSLDHVESEWRIARAKLYRDLEGSSRVVRQDLQQQIDDLFIAAARIDDDGDAPGTRHHHRGI